MEQKPKLDHLAGGSNQHDGSSSGVVAPMDAPWRAVAIGETDNGTPVYDIFTAHNNVVATVAGPAGPLIAAAPDLLEALKALLVMSSLEKKPYNIGPGVVRDRVQMARAAITKAKGAA